MKEQRHRGVKASIECIDRLKLALSNQRNERSGKVWTQTDLANAAGVDAKSVSRFLSRKIRVDECTAIAICQALSEEFDREIDISSQSPQPNPIEPPPIAKLEILADRVSEPPQQRLFGGIPDVPPQWVGRDELLDELNRELVAKKKVIAIVGQGGMGKTSVAAKAIESVGVDIKAKALTQACLYDRVLFFKVWDTGFDTVAAELLKMVEPRVAASQTPRETIDRIIAGLTKYRCLVVLDNLEFLLQPQEVGRAIDIEVDNLLNALVVCGHRSQIIITSREFPQGLKDRRGDGVDIQLVKKVEIPGISMADSIKLLRQLGLTDTEEDLAWVANRVGGNTFILTQLASYAQGQPGLLWEEPEIVCEEAEPVIEAQFERQTAAEQELLRRMCVLRISMNAKHLATLRSIESDADVVTATQVQVKETKSFLLWLKGCGLAESSYDAAVCQNFYALHRLVREVLFSKFAANLRDLYLYAARMYGSFDRPKDENGKSDFRSFEDMRFILEELHFYWLAESDRQKLIQILRSEILPKLNQWCYLDLHEEWLKNILEVWSQLNDLSEMVTTWGLLGDIAYRRCDYDKARDLRNQALEVAIQLNDRPRMANQWFGLGNIADKRGRYDEAETLYKQSLEVWIQLNELSEMATCWGNLGDLVFKRGKDDYAEYFYQKALELMTQLENRGEMADSWVNLGNMASYWGGLGNIAAKRGRYDEAEYRYNQALEVQTQLNDRAGIADSWGNLGNIAFERGSYDEAETLCKKALEMDTQLGNRAGMATSWDNLGTIALRRGDNDKAETLYKKALEMHTQLGNRAGMVTSWVCLGENELNKGNGNPFTAETWLKKALAAPQELQPLDRIAALSLFFVGLYRAMYNERAAQEYYSISHALYTKLGAKGELERIERAWVGR